MTPLPGRRRLIKTAFGSAAGAMLAPVMLRRALAQAPDGPRISTTPMSGRIVLLSGAGANVLAMTGADGGTVLVDGGLAARSSALLDAVAALPGAGPVQTLFNTHWHPEQTGSNETLGRAGARIIAHENTRLWLTTDITRPWEERTFDPFPPEALPTDTFYSTGSLSSDAEGIDYGYLRQAHTDGDIYVRFREANVLAAGDVVSGAGWPLIDWWTGGWIGGLVEGIETLLEVTDADTRVVPGRGPVLARTDLEAQRDMYRTIYQRLRDMLYSGRGPEEALAAEPTKEFDERMGNPQQFVRLAFQSLWGHLSPDA